MFGDFEFLYNTYYYTLSDKFYYLIAPYSLSLFLYASPLWSFFTVPFATLLVTGVWTLLSVSVVGIMAAMDSENEFEAYNLFKEPENKYSLDIASFTYDMQTFLDN